MAPLDTELCILQVKCISDLESHQGEELRVKPRSHPIHATWLSTPETSRRTQRVGKEEPSFGGELNDLLPVTNLGTPHSCNHSERLWKLEMRTNIWSCSRPDETTNPPRAVGPVQTCSCSLGVLSLAIFHIVFHLRIFIWRGQGLKLRLSEGQAFGLVSPTPPQSWRMPHSFWKIPWLPRANFQELGAPLQEKKPPNSASLQVCKHLEPSCLFFLHYQCASN